MNLIHHWLCRSKRWRRIVEERVPWALQDIDLGPDVLELGPGFGVASELISKRVERLTCVEVDPTLADYLRRRMTTRNVTILFADATSLALEPSSFSAVVCFTMLHHVPSAALQDRLFAESFRVLRSGGVFVGIDTLCSFSFRLLHLLDTMVPVDPHMLPARLRAAGFVNTTVEAGPSAFRFRAQKPFPA